MAKSPDLCPPSPPARPRSRTCRMLLRRQLLRVAAVLLIALGVPLLKARAEDRPLDRYAWLVGVWCGQGELPGTGKYADEYAYEWTMDRRFMKTTYVMRVGDKVVWTDVGMVGWDASRECMVGFNFGMEGSIGWGRVIQEEPGDSFLMEGKVVGTKETGEFRVRMKRLPADGLQMIMESKQGDAFVPQPAQTYVRKGSGGIVPAAEPDAPTTLEGLKALEALAGVWQGEAVGPDGRRSPFETAFEWRLSRSFLRITEVSTDAEGRKHEVLEWIGWNPETKSIVSFRFGADGTVRTADAAFSEGTLVLQAMSDWTGGKPAGKTTYRIAGGDGLHMRVDAKPEGGEVPILEATLQRK